MMHSIFLKNIQQFLERIVALNQRKHLITLCFYLEQFLKAGWPLIDTLKEVILLIPALKKPLEKSIQLIEKGFTFSTTLEESSFLFNHFFRACILTYEKVGNLSEGFKELGIYLKWKKDFNDQIIRAALYPCLSLIILIAAAIILYKFFIPEMLIFLEQMNQEIPPFTKFFLNVLEYLAISFEIVGIIIGFALLIIKISVRFSPLCRLVLEQSIYKIPSIGSIKKKQDIIHFLKMINLFHHQGIDILTAVKTAIKGIKNIYFHYIGEKIVEKLLTGQTFSQALEVNHFIPPLIIKILKTGEQTNQFSESLQMVFYLYEQKLKREKLMWVTFLQPCLLLLSGILLASFFYAIIAPLYNVMDRIL